MDSSGYIKGLDGLRCLAALSVVFFHVYPITFSLGWIGVDFFFVLSGFLISRSLINSNCNLRAFYIKRFARLLPAYFLVMTVLAIPLIFLRSTQIIEILPYYFYLQNFVSLYHPFLPGLEHTWSLAIEEQFYVIYPLLLYFSQKKKMERTTILLILLFSSSIIFRFIMYTSGQPAEAQRFLVFSRMDGLALGSLAFFLAERKSSDFKPVRISMFLMVVSCGSLILLAVVERQLWLKNVLKAHQVWLHDSYLGVFSFSHLKYTLLGIIFSSLLFYLIVSNKGSQIRTYLDWGPLSYLGKISYGIYLYHFPILTVLKLLLPQLDRKTDLILCLILTLLVAHLSWNFIEKPCLSKTRSYLNRNIK